MTQQLNESVRFAMFAKYWEPGKVKTRLAKHLGERLACDIYHVFLGHLVTRFSGEFDFRTLVYSPEDRWAEFSELVGDNWQLWGQGKGDLGLRMARFFQRALAERDPQADQKTRTKVVLVGSDTPDLPLETVRAASRHLDDHEFVIGPSTDGGYYLIGMSRFVNVFDNIPWSSQDVLAQTVNRLEQQGIDYVRLPEMTDIDEVEDLQQLFSRLQGSTDPADKNLFTAIQSLFVDKSIDVPSNNDSPDNDSPNPSLTILNPHDNDD